MSASPHTPSEFYDHFVEYQRRTGVNDRIHSLYRRLKRYGLKPSSTVLELGCGIGTLTHLLASRVRTGRIEAVDFSSQSIACARQQVNRPFVTFAVADIVDYKPVAGPFDFITLFDVVEHIPETRHAALFGNLAGAMNKQTLLLVNVPHPASIRYDREHHPDRLQETDLPVDPADLLQITRQCGLSLLYYEAYDIWARKDYVFYVFEIAKPFTDDRLDKRRNAVAQLYKKLQRIRWKYLAWRTG